LRSADQHHHQVGDHVQVHDVALVETAQGVVDHAHRTLDDPLAGGHDGVGLLAAEHVGGDLGRVGEPAQPGVDHRHPGHVQPLLEVGLEGGDHPLGHVPRR
jgi:hypothetical protein